MTQNSLSELTDCWPARSVPAMRVAETPTAYAVGQRVAAEMKRQSIRQSAVAARLGLSQQAVSRRIRGVVAFDVEELERVARLLDVDRADLLGKAA